ncbi:MAG: sulfate/molybdate ABC transporter ATP-binding protein [Desulfomonilaceae bacterium]
MIQLIVKRELIGQNGNFCLEVAATIQENEVVALTGPSGAGKTTLLRMIAGLEQPEEGQIIVDGDVWFEKKSGISLSPQSRSIGFVFQDYALFPTMTVRRNLEYAAGKRKDPRVDELLTMVELENLQHRYPATLSGGQQQRVALARALVRHPKILLLDEPLSALDQAMRRKLQDEILRLRREFGLTVIFVSHDQNEIFRLASRVIYIEDGKIFSQGNPKEVFSSQLISLEDLESVEITQVKKSPNGMLLCVAVGSGLLEIPVSKRDLKKIQEESII